MIFGLSFGDFLLLSSSLFSSGLIILAGFRYLRGSKLDTIREPIMPEYQGVALNASIPPLNLLPPIPRSPVSQDYVRSLLEREILSHAVTRIYEAEAQRKISEEERDQMVLRYEGDLKRINDSLTKIETQAKLEDMEREKEQLTALISTRVKEIENDIRKIKIETGLLPKPRAKLGKKAKRAKRGKDEGAKPSKGVKKPPDLGDIMDRIMDVMKEMEKIEQGEE